MSAQKKMMKIITICILIIFLLATGGIVVLYLAQPLTQDYNNTYPDTNIIPSVVETGGEQKESFTGNLNEFWEDEQ